ncbi:MAG: 2-polyprenyl-3-methyl-5-hydroxy-6-metoxy-1,4-benzoquinol methylase [Sphingobacteriales bacterium]|jgi:2-polyprenyl-3-methyl-5-hydroxy-6-metoxy-1,4-benzoquinol methylase
MEEIETPICPVCSTNKTQFWARSTDVEYWTCQGEEFNYFECLKCISLFIDPFPKNRLQEIYPANYYSYGEQKRGAVATVKEWLDRKYFNKILKPFQGREINVLDYGGGSGWLLDVVKQSYPNVKITQVVDIDKGAQKIAEGHGHRYFCGEIEDFDSEVKFDLVLMLNIIEHIASPFTALKKVESFLSPEGLVLIKTPNMDSLDARVFKKTYWGGLHCPRHWILFSKKSFVTLVQKTNLSVARLKYTQGAPFWAWSVLNTLRKFGLVEINGKRPIMFHPLIPFLHVVFAGVDFIRIFFGGKGSQMFLVLRHSKNKINQN